jgi:hypothetical protein
MLYNKNRIDPVSSYATSRHLSDCVNRPYIKVARLCAPKLPKFRLTRSFCRKTVFGEIRGPQPGAIRQRRSNSGIPGPGAEPTRR